MAGGGGKSGMRVSKADLDQLHEYPVDMRRVAQLFRPHRFALAVVVLIIVASAVLNLVPAFITKRLIDEAIPDKHTSLVIELVVAMLVVTIITQLLGVVQTVMTTRVGQAVMHRLRVDLFRHLQQQPMSFFTRTRAGDLQSRLTNDIKGMQSVVTDAATSIVSNITAALGTAVAMALLSWRLSLISLVVLPPSILLSRRVARLRRAIKSKSQATLSQMQTQIEESLSISGVILAKTMGAGEALADRFAHSSSTLTELELQTQIAGRWRLSTMAIVFATIPAAIYLAAGLPATGDGMTIGTLVAFTGLQTALFKPLMGVLNVGIQITTSKALFSRIFEYLDLPVPIADPEHPVSVDVRRAPGAVQFDHVTLRHAEADRDALHDIVLDVPAGAHVGIVGSTGSGKSTLAALISRLYDPSSGVVRIDGVDLRDMALRDVSALVGVVSQEPYLVHGTIAENLRYARPYASRFDLIEACDAAQVHDLIRSLPEGYETQVGARGHRFSGGEKQRLALARTILRNPPILVLDEATSALDNATERAVQAALDAASRGRTTVTVAHRLSTIRDADLIVVLDAGRIVETGTHEELIELDARYARLVAAQGDLEAAAEEAAEVGAPVPERP